MRKQWVWIIAIGMLFMPQCKNALAEPLSMQPGFEPIIEIRDPSEQPLPAAMRVTRSNAEPWVFTDPYVIDAALQIIAEIEKIESAEVTPSGGSAALLIEFLDQTGEGIQSILFERDDQAENQAQGGAGTINGWEAIDLLVSGSRMALDLFFHTQQDRTYDGHSVFWDGFSACRGADLGDIPMELAIALNPDRSIVELKTQTLLGNMELESPVWPQDIHENSLSRYEASDAQWYMLAQKGSDLLEAYRANDALIQLDSVDISKGTSLHLFQGIFNCGGLCYAGYAVVLAGDAAEYAVSFGGIGNMRDVWTMAEYLYESLDLYSQAIGLL